jgi:hypothetical protein
VTCVECGAKARRSPRCRRCGAPITEGAEDRASGIQTVSPDGVDGPGAFSRSKRPEPRYPLRARRLDLAGAFASQ